ncbi:MAG: acyl-CoA thioesterase [Pseudomonadales bacterium]
MISAEISVLDNDRFLGPAQTVDVQQVFGGHFIAQALLGAQHTAPDGQLAHSMHAYFLKPGDSSKDIEYQVERVRDGRSTCTRQVIARQSGSETFRLTASFSSPRAESEHIYEPAPSVPHYETLAAYQFQNDWAWGTGLECRYVNVPGESEPGGSQVQVWMRIDDTLAQQLQSPNVVLAYLSDATVGDSVFMKKGWSFEDPLTRYLSLDHSIWFHRVAPVNEWLLFEQSAEWIGAGRALSRTRVFSESGDLIATCAQEALAYIKS